MNRRDFLASLGVLAAGCSFNRQRPNQPNIVLFLADDLGYGDLGCYGNREIQTPVIDRLASEGVRFTHFYANAPECTPTRAALLTGRYQQRIGGLECAIGTGNVGRYDDAVRLRAQNQLGLPTSETSMARILKTVGYSTAITGKWHLGYDKRFSPNAHGFDEAFYATCAVMDYFHHVEPDSRALSCLHHNEKPVVVEGYFTDLITQKAVEIIQNQSTDRPFFLYVPYTAPHSPYQGPDDYQPDPLSGDSVLWNQGKGPKNTYRAMVERMDQSIGTILAELEKQDLDQNTLVVFMSDNGASATGSNGAMRGNKGNLFEGGIRVPCIVRWPAILPQDRVSEQPCMTMDFTASMVRIAGGSPSPNREFDGVDILQWLKTGKPVTARTLYWRARRGNRTRKAVRDGDLKYIHLSNGIAQQKFLFDLANDPSELNNLLAARPREARRLAELLSAWEAKVAPQR